MTDKENKVDSIKGIMLGTLRRYVYCRVESFLNKHISKSPRG